MTFRQSINFLYDGISSEDMGVSIASPEGGLFKEDFLSSRSIIEKKIPKRNKPYFQGVESQPLSFSFYIFIEEWNDRDNLRQIQRWLYQDYYKPLIFGSQTDKMYYAILDGESEITHNGGFEGYVKLTMRCDSPFSYSQELFEGKGYKGKIYLNNEGDIPTKPKLWLKMGEIGGSVTIKNLTNNQVCIINNLKPKESIYFDNENENIKSSLEILGVFHYDDHNDIWLQLEINDNEIEITGDATLDYQFRAMYLS